MNMTRYLLLIATLLMLSACGSGASKEKLARHVLNQLKNNNIDGYLKRALSSKDLNQIMDGLEKSEFFQDYSEVRKAKFTRTRSQIDNVIDQHHKKLSKNFQAIFNLGKKKGIDWRKVKYLGLRIGIENPVYELKKFPAHHIYIIFKHKKKRYMLRLNNAMRTSRGWVVVDKIYWDTYEPAKQQK